MPTKVNLFLYFVYTIISASNLSAQSVQVTSNIINDRVLNLFVNDSIGKSHLISSFSINSPHLDSSTILYEYTKNIYHTPQKINISISPIQYLINYNTGFPSSWNDKSMISAKGFQHYSTIGIYANTKNFKLYFQPEFVQSQNLKYTWVNQLHSNEIWRGVYDYVNRIDIPKYYSSKTYRNINLGQSSFKISFKKIDIGVSAENLWWGGGIRNSILMSDNAKGFPHLSINTTAPIKTSVFGFEFQLINGILKNSRIQPIDTTEFYSYSAFYKPKPDLKRYINGLTFVIQPFFINKLFIGVSRVFYFYDNGVNKGLNFFMPVLTGLIPKNIVGDMQREQDQLASAYLKYVFPKSKFEIFFEYARNDLAVNIRDLALEPDHARAYSFGFRGKISPKNIYFLYEMTHLQMPKTGSYFPERGLTLFRNQEGWYAHYQVVHGYTNDGQILGAGIGSGSNSHSIALRTDYRNINFELRYDKIWRNMDLFNRVFYSQNSSFKPWIDNIFGISACRRISKKIYLENSIDFTYSPNYFWKKNFTSTDRVNLNFNPAFLMKQPTTNFNPRISMFFSL